MNKVLTWLNDRTDYRRLAHEMLFERVPGGARWRYVWGSTLVFTFTLQVITGLMLWTAYSPSAQTAWESVYYIQHEMTLGWLVRGIHHFAAQFMVVLMVAHVIQIVVDGAYKAPREVNFWLGIILMQIVLGLALTGYLLPWDQKGYYATRVATNIAAATPVVGKEVQTIAQGGPEYGHHTLTRFFALHAGILPALLVGFLFLHIAAFRRHGVTAPDPDRAPDVAFWPDQVLKDAVACLAVLAAAMGFAIWKGAELNPPADPSESFSAARPEWYFLFLFRFLKFEWVEHFGLAFGAIYVPGALMLVFTLMPILAYFRWGHRFNLVFMWTVILGAVALTVVAMKEDAEDPEHQLALFNAHRDAERIVELAEGPDRIPVDGAIQLLREDPFSQGPRIFARNCSSCHRWDGHDGRGKMVLETDPETGNSRVAAPTAVDLADFGSRDWAKAILVDYGNHFAPLKNAGWYRQYEGWKAAVENGDESAELRNALHAARVTADVELVQSRLGLLELRLQRLDARSGELQVDADKGIDVADEREKLDERFTDLKASIAEAVVSIEMLEASLAAGPDDDATTQDLFDTYEETILDPDNSEMASWSSDSRDALTDEANAKDLDGLVEYLVSLGERQDIDLDPDKIETGRTVAFEGALTSGDTAGACTDCHDTMQNDDGGDALFVLTGEGYGYPDISRYGSAVWLKAFLGDPGTEQFYGLKNHMPAYGERMTEAELDLLVRWMLRDYAPTEVEDYPSRREELAKALAGEE